MKVFHITEYTSSGPVAERALYTLLETVTSFSLCECRGREHVMFSGIHPVLVLDHFDQALNPLAIMNQVRASEINIEWLMIVDNSPQLDFLEQQGLRPLCHLVLGADSKQRQSVYPAQTRIITTVSGGVSFLKQHQLAA